MFILKNRMSLGSKTRDRLYDRLHNLQKMREQEHEQCGAENPELRHSQLQCVRVGHQRQSVCPRVALLDQPDQKC